MTKTLSVVEVDTDLYRGTQFEAVRDGEPVAWWSAPWSAAHTFTGALNAVMPSGRAARVQKASGNPSLLTWSAVPALGGASLVALLRSQVAAVRMGLVHRASGGDGTENGYVCRIEGANLDILQAAAGVYTSLATVPFTVATGTNVWVRFDALNVAGPGVLLRAKAWTGALSDEPAAFMVFTTDTTAPFTSAGAVGLWASSFGGPHDFLCGFFRARALFGSATETLRFAAPTDYLPRELDATPSLATISHQPATISLGENLGQRATVTVAFRDHLGADLGEFVNNGTFWGKFRARGLFRRGMPLRVRRGVLGQALEDFETRHYTLDTFDGATPQGGFSIVARDVLKLADNDRAQAPRANNGFLVASITNVATSATLSPAGIGNAEYAASGYVALGGEEICAFTRSGDVLTLTRGQFGTTAVAHDAEDRVQTCLLFTAQTPAAIINSLFTTYAGVLGAYIPLTDWELECSTYLQRLYLRVIAEPTGVNKLVSELIEQAGLAVWPDDLANLIRLRVLRAVPTNAFEYGEDSISKASLRVQEQPDKRITEVWTYYGVRNPLEPLDELSNYRSVAVKVDLEAATLNGSAVIKKIPGTWIPAFGRDAAERVGDLQLGRFVVPPRKVSFDLPRYSGTPEPLLGNGYRLRSASFQDEAGGAVAVPIQITRVNPQADKVSVEAEEMLFKQFDPADLTNRVIIIETNELNFNLRSAHDSIYPAVTDADVVAGVNLTVIVNAGVIVGSASVATPAFVVGSWPVGFQITLELNGRIQGKGGDGGDADTSGPGMNGEQGGSALYTRFAIDVEHGANAEIFAGSGGGGASIAAGGGGGAGLIPGAGGVRDPDAGEPAVGQPGTTELGGNGGVEGGLDGGDGGDPGQPGENGVPAFGLFGTGGAVGSAIDGVSFVTVTIGSADVRGPTIN